MFEAVEGSVGALLVVRGRSGAVVRKRPTYRRPTSPGQAAQAERMRAAGAVWSSLGAPEAAAWSAYGARQTRRDPVSGKAYSPIGYNAFMELALRALQAAPGTAVPVWPPVGAFLGDSVVVSVSPLPQPPLQDEPLGEGALRFSASGANAAGVVTELLVQRLANVRRKPTAQYKSMAFVRFVAGALVYDLPAAAGVYACAARQVDPATGQARLPTPLGVVVVG